MSIHFSIDIETIGKGPRAGVLSIGAMLFDPYGSDLGSGFDTQFYRVLDIEEQFALNWVNTQDISSLTWWLRQDRAARTTLLINAVPTYQALTEFKHWVQKGCMRSEEIYLWGNGNMFDNAILRNLYQSAGIDYPAHWKNDLDLRTLLKTVHLTAKPYDKPGRVGVHHNALDDAIYQATYIQNLLRALR